MNRNLTGSASRRLTICDLAFDEPSEVDRARLVLRRRGLDPSVVGFSAAALTPGVLDQADVISISGRHCAMARSTRYCGARRMQGLSFYRARAAPCTHRDSSNAG